MKRFAVLGYPIQHSRSPEIFHLFSQQTGCTLDYEAIEVTPETLAATLTRLNAQGYHGVNLTSPLKEKAYALMTSCTARAKAAKAINVLTFAGNAEYHGDNTDGVGFVRDLTQNKKYSLTNKSIFILGAGGAVRGILPALIEESPRKITIANRTVSRAEKLVEEFLCFLTPSPQPSPALEIISTVCDSGRERGMLCPLSRPLMATSEIISSAGEGWGEGVMSTSEEPYDLIIHAIPVKDTHYLHHLSPQILHKSTVCYDLTYAKNPTPFLQWAKQNSIIHRHDGRGMLLEQAAEAFHLWTQCRVDTSPLIDQF